MRPPDTRALVVLAVALGALAAVLAVAFPFLPVQQDTLELRWPTAERGTDPVTSPLVAVRPERISATLPCDAIAERGTVLTTAPPDAPGAEDVGLVVTAEDGTVTVVSGGTELVDAPLPGGPGCTLSITSTAIRTTVLLDGRALLDQATDRRPEVVGVYSTLRDPAGLDVTIIVDNRYDSTAGLLKIAAGTGAVLALLGALAALHGVDHRRGRRLPRLHLRRPGADPLRDAVVIGTLAVWLLIGAVTADDGYILTMVRTAADTGYVGNYYRWFDVPEAPFGWFYELYAPWAAVSDSVVWLRLPSLVMGVLSWLLLSRGLLPRLGRQVRQSRAAGWAAGAVFLCFWLPYDSGLRPEPVVVLAALVAYVALERALVVRRLLPVALGLVAAAFAVAATPTGLLAVAPFVAAARPLLELFRRRAAADGWAVVLTPLLGAGLVVLVAVFGDQTAATVLEATRLRTEIGPNVPWYNELARYVDLFAPNQDGSLARRFPVLLLLLCVGVCTVVILRRGSVPGAALGPSRRLIAVTVLGFAVLALTPTKWTHHFGAFAAVGGGIGALAALATSAAVLRSGRNRTLFLAAVLGVAALAATGPNAWMYVSNWGIPWFDRAPVVGGIELYEVLLWAATACLAAAGWSHLRGPHVSGGRALRLGSAPLVVICGAVVLFDVGSLAKAVHAQRTSYSVGGDVLTRGGTGCGLSDRVRVGRTTLTETAGDAPMLLDWPVAFPHPCLRPFAVVDGVAEVPAYRVLADEQLRGLGDTWSAAPAGGPLAWLELVGEQVEVSARLAGEPDRDWGELRRIDLYEPTAGRPDAVRGTAVHWGWESPGQQGDPPPGRPGGGR